MRLIAINRFTAHSHSFSLTHTFQGISNNTISPQPFMVSKLARIFFFL